MAQQRDEFTRDPLVRAFGAVLRGHREARGLSRPQLAEALGCSPQWIEKLETGQSPCSMATAQDLDTYFGGPEIFYTMWKELKRAGRDRMFPPGFPRYMGLEGEAETVREYETQVIPGLLQTPAYASTLLGSGHAPESLEERLRTRMARQAILEGDDPTRAFFIIDEAVLRRPVAAPEVMREQLAHICDLVERSNHIEVWVVPFESVSHAGLDGAFTVLDMPDGRAFAYHEGPEIGMVIEDPGLVAEYGIRFAQIAGEAARGEDSIKLITRAMEGFA